MEPIWIEVSVIKHCIVYKRIDELRFLGSDVAEYAILYEHIFKFHVYHCQVGEVYIVECAVFKFNIFEKSSKVCLDICLVGIRHLVGEIKLLLLLLHELRKPHTKPIKPGNTMYMYNISCPIIKTNVTGSLTDVHNRQANILQLWGTSDSIS